MTPREERDLGFGTVAAGDRRHRLLNPDGTFNVRRQGHGFRAALNAYHALLTISWPRFLGLFAALYLSVNVAFAAGYLVLAPGGLAGPGSGLERHPFWQAFFFSVETFGTIGYGVVSPIGVPANIVMTVESFVSVLGIALAAGIMFARFSRPVAHIRFSRSAVIAPYRGGRAFEFRIVNERNSDMVDLQARVFFSRIERHADGTSRREFYQLPLERDRVTFFPLSWTVVHPIDERSPLAGATPDRLAVEDAEIWSCSRAPTRPFPRRCSAGRPTNRKKFSGTSGS